MERKFSFGVTEPAQQFDTSDELLYSKRHNPHPACASVGKIRLTPEEVARSAANKWATREGLLLREQQSGR
ncbi:MAG: hypothetical protein D6816_18655 [Bacteroidetes bacterium]|nr:MAG: hypothetical protein D6816_18655 [Bacteroidota bacterium]